MKKKSLTSLTLEGFLEYKTLYYDKIDFTVIQNAYKTIQSHLKLPYVIHIVGTNGKGTTGRFLAHYLYQSNKRVLHYSSPHIERFNERIWINGQDVSNEALEQSHKQLLTLLDEESLKKLTYFEYTTLLALVLSSGLDYIVLEAGLGGEFDATNVVKNDLSLITTIGLDHVNFLGNTIEKIAKTKMRSVDTHMIVGHQVEPDVLHYAKAVKKDKNDSIQITQANMNYNLEALPLDLPCYLKNNLKLCIEALVVLGFPIDLNKFETLTFKGRCQKITDNITIDVGHNPLAATEIVKEFLPNNEKITLVYNAYEDKDYEKVLKILKPIIKQVEILNLSDKRVVKREILTKICDKLNIITTQFTNLNPKENYLVFGSFLVVEEFLKTVKEADEK